ncbi:TrbI/VirB10 family protein [Terasakiella sp. SH-1]|uniref:TrbI/VirB10 family protein n=1 Tax=Terasakiella sp. SH-1 TaxID=2560057 RepID=UPI0010731DF5|nr:TrbI/VirB10 family protein [Terasakiella sp. SH-1]
MSTIACSFFMTLGLTLSGVCDDTNPKVKAVDLPEEDRTVWEYEAPAPPPPPKKVEPPKPPVMPPVVIEKTIIKEVKVPVEPKPKPMKVKKAPPKPDPVRVWLEQRAKQRPSFNDTDNHFVELASLKGSAGGLSAPSLSSEKGLKTPAPKSYQAEKVESGEPISNSRIFTADRYMAGFLEGGINSQLSSKEGGDIVIQISRHVFGYGTRNILIPKGSRLLCNYDSPDSLNATRVAITCFRILLGGDQEGKRVEIAQLEATTRDAQGRAGTTGTVDNHFDEQYGTALGLAGISALVRGASAYLTTNSSGETTTTGEIADSASQELGTRFGEISASILEKTTSIVPTITVSQGKRVFIKPRKDWYLKEVNS